MKKVQILIITLLVGSVAMFSFKKAETATKYGDTGSVKIDIYKTFLGKKTEKINSVTLNASISCFENDAASAKQKIQSELEYKASQKIRVLEEAWEYADEINYRITSCD